MAVGTLWEPTAMFLYNALDLAILDNKSCLSPYLAKLFYSGTIAGPHTDYVCAWSEHSIALSHVSSVNSKRDCSRAA